MTNKQARERAYQEQQQYQQPHTGYGSGTSYNQNPR
jgi:hypothetical protein